MDKLEKVIKGIKCCLSGGNADSCGPCPYKDECANAVGKSPSPLRRDAISLLKAQEPVKPYIDYDGQDVWRCGSCGATLFHLSHTQADENEQNCVKFCRYCGKAVKWE